MRSGERGIELQMAQLLQDLGLLQVTIRGEQPRTLNSARLPEPDLVMFGTPAQLRAGEPAPQKVRA